MHSTRRLVVIRHSKAEPYAESDVKRALSDRGRSDAARAGEWLGRQAIRPDVALVSASVRTEETWQLIAEAAGWAIEPELDRGLYGSDEDSVLDLLSTVDEDASTVVVIGHNPTMAMVVQLLDDGEAPPEVSGPLTEGFPTSAVAVFEVPVPWSRLAPGVARLQAVYVGRG